MRKNIILMSLAFCFLLNANVIYLTTPDQMFDPQQFYFPGTKMPQRKNLNLYLIYENGSGSIKNQADDITIAHVDDQYKKIVLSYSLLDNFFMYIGRNAGNNSYDLNQNSIFVQGYNQYLNNQLTTYLTSSQYNLMFPFGYKPPLHPDRDRRDNLFGFTFKMGEIGKQKIGAYFDYYSEDRKYINIVYSLKYGIAPVPVTFMDLLMQIEDNYYRGYVSYDCKICTLYGGFENMHRRTSMHDGASDDFHIYNTLFLKLDANWQDFKVTLAEKKKCSGVSLFYQSKESFGIEMSYRKMKNQIQDSSNYFANIFNTDINFIEDSQTMSIAITQKF
ncbi:MAG: hypothetical protein PHW04_02195 [Candidatus Wallbacteria bacterium]|nr:hypothetical protein [Candidatus Wallbacteria bacterium]